MLASAAQARPADRSTARPPARVAADHGGNHGGGNQGSSGKGGPGNSKGGAGGNDTRDQHNGGSGGGSGSDGGMSPGAITASQDAAAQRVLDEALAASGNLSAKLRAELAKLLGHPVSSSRTPASPSGSKPAPSPAGNVSTVVVAAAGAAAAAEDDPHPGTAPAGETGAAAAPTAPARVAAPHRGLQPLSLPMLASADDWAVTAVFGFFVLGLLWTAWMASLRPVLGRPAPAAAGRTPAASGDAPAHSTDPPPGVTPAPSPRRRPGVHRR